MVSTATVHIILYTFCATFIGTWACAWYYVHSRKEPICLEMQAWVGDTRKEGETAIYRNLIAPPSGNLVNGLDLCVKNKSYKYRRGNFGDIWQCSLDLSKETGSFIEFQNHDDAHVKLSLQELDVLTMKIYQFFQKFYVDSKSEKKMVIGTTCATYKYNGFVQSIAGFITSLKSGDHYGFEILDSIPRSKSNVDILFIDSFEMISKMNNSENWYKLIVVAEPLSKNKSGALPDNVISWDSFMLKKDAEEEQLCFQYEAGEDYEKDDDKNFFQYKTMLFNQLNLVSSMAAFVKTFPVDHTLSAKDVLQVLVFEDNNKNATTSEKDFQNTQMWSKLLCVLMHGGSAILTATERFKVEPATTILSLSADPFAQQLQKLGRNITLFQKLKLIWAMNFISENIFVGFGSILSKKFNLRTIFMENRIKDYSKCVDYSSLSLSKYGFVKRRTVTSEVLSEFRSLLGSRVILETFAPLNIMGPVFVTHFYDYRVLPHAVDKKYQFCGVINSCLETKLVETENMDIKKRQGMVCVRGFNIGRPTGGAYEDALKLSESFDKNREGWMPLLDVYGVFGVDQCFYEM